MSSQAFVDKLIFLKPELAQYVLRNNLAIFDIVIPPLANDKLRDFLIALPDTVFEQTIHYVTISGKDITECYKLHDNTHLLEYQDVDVTTPYRP